MSDTVTASVVAYSEVIAVLEADIAMKERHIREAQKAVNTLCRKVGIPEKYVIVEIPGEAK